MYKWDSEELPKTKVFLFLFLGNVDLVCLVVWWVWSQTFVWLLIMFGSSLGLIKNWIFVKNSCKICLGYLSKGALVCSQAGLRCVAIKPILTLLLRIIGPRNVIGDSQACNGKKGPPQLFTILFLFDHSYVEGLLCFLIFFIE